MLLVRQYAENGAARLAWSDKCVKQTFSADVYIGNGMNPECAFSLIEPTAVVSISPVELISWF